MILRPAVLPRHKHSRLTEASPPPLQAAVGHRNELPQDWRVPTQDHIQKPRCPHLQLHPRLPHLQRVGRPQRQSQRAHNNDRPETQLHLELPNPHEDRGFTWMRRDKIASTVYQLIVLSVIRFILD